MSSTIIEDGTGDGKRARVNINNRLVTQGISEAEADHAAEVGKRFNLNTGDVTLTSANESAIMYLKNNETSNLSITALIYNFGTSTGGSGDWKASVYRNPTVGTVVDSATGVSMNANMNFGSAITLTADVYKGTEATTLTDGDLAIESIVSGGRVTISLGSMIIPPGKSLGVKVTPPTGNTSVIVNCAVACYVRNDDVTGGELS